MTSSASKGEDSHGSTLATPQDIAHWLLVAEAGKHNDPEALADAGEHIYHRLRMHLGGLLGIIGFNALWARAIHVAQPMFYTGDATAMLESQAAHVYGLDAALRGGDSATVWHNLEVAFASLITLLFTFIGPELTLHFIRQLWPDLPPHSVGSHLDGGTP